MVANPRVWKEANSLASAGYRTSVLTVVYDNLKLKYDRELLHSSVDYQPVVDLSKESGSYSDVYLSRLRRKSAQILKKYFRIDTVRLMVYRPSKLLKAALNLNADLYIAHQETGLFIGNELLKKGKRVAFDIEDWYSRDYVNSMRAIKLLDLAESFALKNASYVSCPSDSMSDSLTSHFSLTERPCTIYNGFSIIENDNILNSNIEKDSLVWFSQVIGPNRGLETLVKAMALIRKPMKVHLAGDAMPSFKQELEAGFSKTCHQLYFHSAMEHHQLLPFISTFGIGLAIENNFPTSRETTITNKILQYVQAGISILATNTKGQIEVAKYISDRIRIVKTDDPEEWAREIEYLNEKKAGKCADQIKIFSDHFSWEAQEQKLLSLVRKVLA
jgi:glycosyltransferase involved in cell wall biosynthesis